MTLHPCGVMHLCKIFLFLVLNILLLLFFKLCDRQQLMEIVDDLALIEVIDIDLLVFFNVIINIDLFLNHVALRGLLDGEGIKIGHGASHLLFRV